MNLDLMKWYNNYAYFWFDGDIDYLCGLPLLEILDAEDY